MAHNLNETNGKVSFVAVGEAIDLEIRNIFCNLLKIPLANKIAA